MYARVRCKKTLKERSARTFATHEKHARRAVAFALRQSIVELGARVRGSAMLHRTAKAMSFSMLRRSPPRTETVSGGGNFLDERRESGNRLDQK